MKNANKQKAKTKNKKRGNIITYQYFLITNSTEARALTVSAPIKRALPARLYLKKLKIVMTFMNNIS